MKATIMNDIDNVLMKTFEFTEEQINMIAHALRTTIRVNQKSVDDMYDICGVTDITRETGKRIVEGNLRLKTLLNYIEQA